jgi:hypothetical protein
VREREGRPAISIRGCTLERKAKLNRVELASCIKKIAGAEQRARKSRGPYIATVSTRRYIS